MSVRVACVCAFSALLLAACAGKKPVVDVEEANYPPPFNVSSTAVLICPELSPVTIMLNDNAARIDAAGGPYDMLRVISASGELYEAGGSELWLKGEAAFYRQPGEDAGRECRVYAVKSPWESAELRNVAFRALGQEPAWLLEVVPDKWILLQLDHGRHRVIVPPVAPTEEGSAQRFVSASDDAAIDVLVTPASCTDSMSGEVFPTTVQVTFGSGTLQGCGRWLD